MSVRILAIVALATLPITGCVAAAVGAVGAVGVTAAQDKTLGEAVDDATAGAEIKSKMLRLSAKRFGSVDVEVVSGLALLSGRVDKPQDRAEAEGIAWTSTRVEDVANEIKIEGSNGFVANVADEIISARVRSRLVGSGTVKSINFNIETYDGVVYLMGVARSARELEKAATEASYVGGVKQVVSYVRLRDARPPRNGAPISQRQSSYQSAPHNAYVGSAEDELLGGAY